MNFIPAHFIALVINTLVGIGIALCTIYIVLAGIQYMTSMGDQEKTKRARSSLVNAIVGFIIVISAPTIIHVIGNTLGWTMNTADLNFIVPIF